MRRDQQKASFTSPGKGEVGRAASGRGSTTSRFLRTPTMTARARRLRSNLTEAERKLWYALRREQIGGLSFRRQHPMGRYVLDFYCSALGLAVEVDGGHHTDATFQAQDDRRTRWLNAKGVLVLRFWNNDVLGNLAGVLTEIATTAASRRACATPSLTLPLAGGGNNHVAKSLALSAGGNDRGGNNHVAKSLAFPGGGNDRGGNNHVAKSFALGAAGKASR